MSIWRDRRGWREVAGEAVFAAFVLIVLGHLWIAVELLKWLNVHELNHELNPAPAPEVPPWRSTGTLMAWLVGFSGAGLACAWHGFVRRRVWALGLGNGLLLIYALLMVVAFGLTPTVPMVVAGVWGLALLGAWIARPDRPPPVVMGPLPPAPPRVVLPPPGVLPPGGRVTPSAGRGAAPSPAPKPPAGR